MIFFFLKLINYSWIYAIWQNVINYSWNSLIIHDFTANLINYTKKLINYSRSLAKTQLMWLIIHETC